MNNRYLNSVILIAVFIIALSSSVYADSGAAEYKKLGDSFFRAIDGVYAGGLTSYSDKKNYYEGIINSNKTAISYYEKLKSFNPAVANKKIAECYIQIADSYIDIADLYRIAGSVPLYEKAIENYTKAKSISHSFYKKMITGSPGTMWDYVKSSEEGGRYVFFIDGQDWANEWSRICYTKIAYAYLNEENLDKSFEAVEKVRQYNYDDGFLSSYYPSKLEEQARKCNDKAKKIRMYEKLFSMAPDYPGASKIMKNLNALKNR